MFKRDAKLQDIMLAPSLSAADKNSIINELASKIGVQDKGDTVKNFLKTLAENNRLSVLEGVCEKFGTLMSAYRGEVELTITSAAVRYFLLCFGVEIIALQQSGTARA